MVFFAFWVFFLLKVVFYVISVHRIRDLPQTFFRFHFIIVTPIFDRVFYITETLSGLESSLKFDCTGQIKKIPPAPTDGISS